MPLAALLALPAIPAAAQRDVTRPANVTAYAYQFRFGQPTPAIQVSWSRPSRVPSSYVLGHVVWRSDLLGSFGIVAGTYGDTLRRFIDTSATRSTTAYDGAPGSDDAGSPTVITNVPGVVPGQRYRYQVATAYINGLQDRDFDGQPDTGARFMSPLSMPSAWVTALAPPAITSVNGSAPDHGLQVNLRRLELEWEQTPGAETYVIWASRDPRFRRSRTVKLGTVRSVPVDLGGAPTLSRTFNAHRGSLRRAKWVYLAVGARNSGDRHRPRPFGAIFSRIVAVRPDRTPPPPPGR